MVIFVCFYRKFEIKMRMHAWKTEKWSLFFYTTKGQDNGTERVLASTTVITYSENGHENFKANIS